MSLNISSVSVKSSLSKVSVPESNAESPNEYFEENLTADSNDIPADKNTPVFPTFRGSLSHETMQTLLKMHSR